MNENLKVFIIATILIIFMILLPNIIGGSQLISPEAGFINENKAEEILDEDNNKDKINIETTDELDNDKDKINIETTDEFDNEMAKQQEELIEDEILPGDGD